MLVLLHAVVAAAGHYCGLYCAVSSLPTDVTQHLARHPTKLHSFEK